MKRTKRYNGDDDSAVTEDTTSGTSPASASEPTSTSVASSSPASFGAAFKAARASGDKTFTYNGKSYTTELAGAKNLSSTSRSNRFGQPGGSISDAGSGRDMVEKQSVKTPVDVTKLSLAERAKISRANMRQGSGNTDTRSVNERIRSTLGMKKGGATKKMAAGGSASSRADGIATKGKTRGKMC